jgi:SAM-dependent methyltransferase
MTKIDFDNYATDYNELVSRQTSFFDGDNDYFARYKIEIIHKHTNPNIGSVLDFGCGVGRSIGYLHDAFPAARIVGCDPSQKSLMVARQHMRDFEFLSPNEIPAIPQFDVILASCVFHHIAPEDRAASLRYCVDRMNTGGRLFVFEHNPLNPITRRLVATCPFDKDAILLQRREMIARMRGVGLQIDKADYCLFFPGAMSALRRYERVLGWLPLGGQYFVIGVRS